MVKKALCVSCALEFIFIGVKLTQTKIYIYFFSEGIFDFPTQKNSSKDLKSLPYTHARERKDLQSSLEQSCWPCSFTNLLESCKASAASLLLPKYLLPEEKPWLSRDALLCHPFINKSFHFGLSHAPAVDHHVQ